MLTQQSTWQYRTSTDLLQSGQRKIYIADPRVKCEQASHSQLVSWSTVNSQLVSIEEAQWLRKKLNCSQM